ncbi:MAG: hypothetical protein AB1894_17045 [Chloroflexota bacterium]
MSEIQSYPTLQLVQECKIHALLPSKSVDDRMEASGVCLKDGRFYVIFDNSPHIARLDASLAPGHPANTLIRQRGESTGFEDITYHQTSKHFLVILEALIFDENTYKPNIEEYTEDFRYLGNAWVDFPLQGLNKGMEGLAYIRHGGEDYLLGLCESNKCRAGKEGRKPGGGRIQLLQRSDTQWEHRGTLKLPESVAFEDYACLDADNHRLAVVSQMTSALWVGQLCEDRWEWVDNGRVYQFPRDPDGNILYCNVEGVNWITPTQIVVVSDKRKPGEQSKHCTEKDQSIHIFNLL